MAERGRTSDIILRFIYSFLQSNGYPPAIREIAQAANLASPSTVHGHLKRLESKGFLVRHDDKNRAIELTEAGLAHLGIYQAITTMPVFELATIKFDDNSVPQFPIPPNLLQHRGKLFMMRYHGSHLKNMGILDGDNIIVRRQETIDNGEIAIVRYRADEYYIGRYFQETERIRITTDNDGIAPDLLDPAYLTILGRVVGLYRDSIY
ncbi:transcriptional repressor LexA [Weissella soli]|uniref:transcriptional repressor LexA n=2 Tax=Weissella soli TaxID=155866 RepID=UPI001F459FFE|nr:transcriptional repressor LexA [Weissella soli]GJM49019.1 LexA repressor [Weissella soli]